MPMPHSPQKLHILAYLLMVPGIGTSELEIDDNPVGAVGHHAVGTPFDNLAVNHAEYRALVEEAPSA